jgi:hypothetical protein
MGSRVLFEHALCFYVPYLTDNTTADVIQVRLYNPHHQYTEMTFSKDPNMNRFVTLPYDTWVTCVSIRKGRMLIVEQVGKIGLPVVDWDEWQSVDMPHILGAMLNMYKKLMP